MPTFLAAWAVVYVRLPTAREPPVSMVDYSHTRGNCNPKLAKTILPSMGYASASVARTVWKEVATTTPPLQLRVHMAHVRVRVRRIPRGARG
jgi:hypothetical protein